MASSTPSPSVTGASSINMDAGDNVALLRQNNLNNIRSITKISRIYSIIILTITILSSIGSVGIVFKVLFMSTSYSSRLPTTGIFITSTKSTTVGLSQGTITTGKLR